ncbi:ABC transporter permease subunit [Clostridium swellfunianum]|uniref:ABC transporter permease n=1 Tax=Clostridium swellfunianum TaxID=1367462 RepID=UPI00202FD9B1|nr:ABC transporter permease subunit [Clostridium swellfunianum]MCM0646856.1 ABC transporter permease subunit [Clostridium swellfunianum]
MIQQTKSENRLQIKQRDVNVKKSNLKKSIKNYWLLYLLLIPVLLWYLIFSYLPMGGLILSFKEFDYNSIWTSEFVGLANFKVMFKDVDFWRAFKNTIIFSFGKLAFHFPSAIILAMILNEVRKERAKKFFQTVLTFPHFISWVVLSGVVITMFGNSGSVNQLMRAVGADPISPLTSLSGFRPFIWLSNIWKEVGWDTIIYLAAFAGIDPVLYEAASIDGANRWHKLIHVSWPGIRSTVAIMLILAVGQLMTNGANFDQIFNLYSSPVYAVADTIDTYTYRMAFSVGTDFGYTTAVGLFKSIINLVLILTANTIVKKSGENSIF